MPLSVASKTLSDDVWVLSNVFNRVTDIEVYLSGGLRLKNWITDKFQEHFNTFAKQIKSFDNNKPEQVKSSFPKLNPTGPDYEQYYKRIGIAA